jgi:hypothetical protein
MKVDYFSLPTGLDPLYRLAMLHICDLQSDATHGREYRRVRIAGKFPR